LDDWSWIKKSLDPRGPIQKSLDVWGQRQSQKFGFRIHSPDSSYVIRGRQDFTLLDWYMKLCRKVIETAQKPVGESSGAKLF